MTSGATADVTRSGSDEKRGPALKLEVVVLPVSDVERAKRFYEDLGWRLDADFAKGHAFRVVQFTPPGSPASIHFGTGLTTAEPGSVKNSYLVVDNIEAARAALIAGGANVSGISHRLEIGGADVAGPDPDRRSYNSFASFSDPDGNSWLLQEITGRLPSRMESGGAAFTSAADLSSALQRAAFAHGEHEKRTGAHDPDWPQWYAAYIVQEQSGGPLPV
jgi:catechol 2,3-dioxygenase-like lactoylglutathione lyase family enzyme